MNQSQLEIQRREMPVIGFRLWNTADRYKVGVGWEKHLASVGITNARWVPGVNHAECRASHIPRSVYDPPSIPHAAPSLDCHCGFWVLSNLDDVPVPAPPNPRGRVVKSWIARPDPTRRYSIFTVTWDDGTVTEETVQPPQAALWVVGAVIGWGRVLQHADKGWRAEHARVLALLDCKVSADHLTLTEEMAALYGVPVLSRAALELYVREFGEKLPAEANVRR